VRTIGLERTTAARELGLDIGRIRARVLADMTVAGSMLEKMAYRGNHIGSRCCLARRTNAAGQLWVVGPTQLNNCTSQKLGSRRNFGAGCRPLSRETEDADDPKAARLVRRPARAAQPGARP
jgi:hypothetical protein